jgi:hypothetical protein
MARIVFEKIQMRGVRRWTESGKRRQETRIFMQTVNPFNKGADGLPKTREQIRDEISREREEWLAGGGQ